MGRIGMLGLCSFGSPYSWVASKVDLVGFLQRKEFLVKFAVQCGCRVSFK